MARALGTRVGSPALPQRPRPAIPALVRIASGNSCFILVLTMTPLERTSTHVRRPGRMRARERFTLTESFLA